MDAVALEGPLWPVELPSWDDARAELGKWLDHLSGKRNSANPGHETKPARTQKAAAKSMGLVTLPFAFLGAWVVIANLVNNADTAVLPKPLADLVAGLRGLGSRRRQSQRRRLASRLQPLTLEREWLLGVLPPSVTHAVLARLDPASLKALRAASRRTRMCVSSHTRRLDLDPRGVRRFSTAPLHVLFPGLRELHLHLRPTSAGPVSRTVGVGDAGGTGAGGGAGVRQLLALAESGALASLPRLQVLGVDAGFGQPGGGGGCRFSRQQWKAFVAALPGPAIHGSGSGPQGASPGMRLGAGAGPGGALRVRLDVRCLPARSLWTPLPQHAAPEWQDALWAVKWMARQRPQVRLELEGPPLLLPGPGALAAFRGAPGSALRQAAFSLAPCPHLARYRFDGLASMQHLQQLTLRLPAAAWGGSLAAACGALQELRQLEVLSLPGSVVRDEDFPALARVRSVRTMLVSGLVLSAAPPPSARLSSVERLVVCGPGRLDVAPAVGLLPALPSLAALGLLPGALAQPVALMPRPPTPAAAAQGQGGQGQQQQQQPQAANLNLHQELLQHQQQVAAALAGQQQQQQQAAAAAAAAAAQVWAAHQQQQQQQHQQHPTRTEPFSSPVVVSLRELCLSFPPRPSAAAAAAAARAQAQGQGQAQQAAAPTAAVESHAADLLAQVAALPTLQRLRVWGLASPEAAVRLLRPLVEQLQAPLVGLELHDLGPPERLGRHGQHGRGRGRGQHSVWGAGWAAGGDGGDNESEEGDEAGDDAEEEEDEEEIEEIEEGYGGEGESEAEGEEDGEEDEDEDEEVEEGDEALEGVVAGTAGAGLTAAAVAVVPGGGGAAGAEAARCQAAAAGGDGWQGGRPTSTCGAGSAVCASCQGRLRASADAMGSEQGGDVGGELDDDDDDEEEEDWELGSCSPGGAARALLNALQTRGSDCRGSQGSPAAPGLPRRPLTASQELAALLLGAASSVVLVGPAGGRGARGGGRARGGSVALLRAMEGVAAHTGRRHHRNPCSSCGCFRHRRSGRGQLYQAVQRVRAGQRGAAGWRGCSGREAVPRGAVASCAAAAGGAARRAAGGATAARAAGAASAGAGGLRGAGAAGGAGAAAEHGQEGSERGVGAAVGGAPREGGVGREILRGNSWVCGSP